MPITRTPPEHTVIHGCFPVKKRTSGLTARAGWWHIVFYGAGGQTQTRNLWTKDLDHAVQLRDQLYAEAKRAGRGGQSKMERRAQEVLANPESLEGLSFKVTFGNQVHTFDTPEAARKCRDRIAAEIVGRAQGTRQS